MVFLPPRLPVALLGHRSACVKRLIQAMQVLYQRGIGFFHGKLPVFLAM
jgi:hypothetical protein